MEVLEGLRPNSNIKHLEDDTCLKLRGSRVTANQEPWGIYSSGVSGSVSLLESQL